MQKGSILKAILTISIPVILANLLQTVYQLIDTFWVGRMGTDAVASVSLSFPILFFLMSGAMGFAMAGSILVAQYNGKGNTRKLTMTVGQTFSLVLVVALILCSLGFWWSPQLISVLSDDPIVIKEAVAYLRISFLAMPAMFIYVIFQSFLQGVGEVKIPMLIILGTVIINFFIDPLFMFGWWIVPPLGVKGVALATWVTESLAAIIGITILIKGIHGIKLKLNCLKLKKKWIRKIIVLGFPSSMEMSARSLGMVLVTFIVSTIGTLAVASYGIGTRILSFVIIPSVGFSIATSVLIGNNLGSGNKERAEKIAKTGLKIGFWVLSIMGILIFIFAPRITYFLAPGDESLIKEASNFIRTMALSFGFLGIQIVTIGILKSAGKTTLSMSLAMFHVFCLVTLSLFFSKVLNWQEWGIWWAYPIGNFLAMILAFYFYIKKDWLKKKLI